MAKQTIILAAVASILGGALGAAQAGDKTQARTPPKCADLVRAFETLELKGGGHLDSQGQNALSFLLGVFHGATGEHYKAPEIRLYDFETEVIEFCERNPQRAAYAAIISLGSRWRNQGASETPLPHISTIAGRPAPQLGASDIEPMRSTHQDNEVRYKRDYVGKEFSAELPFWGGLINVVFLTNIVSSLEAAFFPEMLSASFRTMEPAP